ncbi:VWA domain-containing protein [Butyrivibrio sp. VCB2001]|uniref:VWA domain-containing protein n=1 Tax=Butyrivibrio sp. VCB2001 TaxID=1280667 RepID=UPI0003FC5A11|nr:vWA domain-containing protein [Butyrivibrio sp. VCB2001]
MSEIDFFGLDSVQEDVKNDIQNNDLVIESAFDYPQLLNDGAEKHVKLCLSVKPSDEIRKEFGSDKYQNSHVCLVIDTSDSMYWIVDDTGFVASGKKVVGEDGVTRNLGSGGISKLDIACASAKKVAEMLRSGDTVDCVYYADEAAILFESLGINDKEEICNRIDHISDKGNNTNISAGLRMAGEVLEKYQDASPKVILFFTDGEPTGVDTVEANASTGKWLAEKNIVVESMGFGEKDVNFENLSEISIPTGGVTQLIKYPDQFASVFNAMFQRAQTTVITNVSLSMTVKAGAKVGDYYRGTPDNVYLGLNEGNSIDFNIGQIEKNQMYKYYFDMTVPGQASDYEGLINTASVTLSYQVPSKYGNSIITKKVDIPITFTSDTALSKQINGDINVLFRLAEVKKFDEKRKEAYNIGDDEGVIREIKKIIQIYTDLQKPIETSAYEEMLKDFMENRSISKAVLNKATSSSSQAQDAGILDDLDDGELSGFAARLKIRRKG